MFTSKGGYRSFNYNIKNLIKQGQNDKIKSLIKGLAPSDLVDGSNISLLHVSARYNNHDLTKHLIKIKCNVNAASDLKLTPLIVAATNNSFKTAQVLIEANADMYATNLSNKSALQLLLSNKKIPLYLIKCCLKKVKSDNPSDEAAAEKLFTANCPLHVVVHLQKPSITRQIIERYGPIDDPQLFRTAMDIAFKLEDKENVRVLLQSGAEIDISNRRAIPFLHKLCLSGRLDGSNFELVNAFLKNVANWNLLEKEDLPWLDSILRFGSKQEIGIFVQHSVINECVKNKFPGYDLLVNLFGNPNADKEELLKQLPFNIDSHTGSGFTALHFAAIRLDLILAKTLLELGANPNTQDFEGCVPLTVVHDVSVFLDEDDGFDDTLFDDKLKMVVLLLQSGADPQLDMGAYNWVQNWVKNFSCCKLDVMLAQLAINESKGMAIKVSSRQVINSIPRARSIYETCSQQLERFKTMKVYGSITLYTILTTEVVKLANSIRDQEALETISNNLEECHFYYFSLLWNSKKHILDMMNLREKACAFICEITGWPNSQHIVLEKILSFLTYKDLLVFE